MAPIRALLNILHALSRDFSITIFVLRKVDAQTLNSIPKNVLLVNMSSYSLLKSIKTINQEIDKKLAYGHPVATFSMGLLADIINCKLIRKTPKVVSLRGSLHNTYKIDYGVFGSLLWRIHYDSVKRASNIIVMTRKMASEFFLRTSVKPEIIGNFIDEKNS